MRSLIVLVSAILCYTAGMLVVTGHGVIGVIFQVAGVTGCSLAAECDRKQER